MRTITVDLSGLAPEISTQYGGELGEHQAVELKVIPEKGMSEDEDIAFYYLLFAVEGGLVASRVYDPDEEIICALWNQLTERRNLKFQLIGTNGLETIIAKSPIITLYLGNSLEGTVIGIDDNRDSLIAMIGAFNERLDVVEEKVDNLYTVELLDEDISHIGELKYTISEIVDMWQRGQAMTLASAPVVSVEDYRVEENAKIGVMSYSSRCMLIYPLANWEWPQEPLFTYYFMSEAQDAKLEGIESGAEVNLINDVVDSDNNSLVNSKVAHIPTRTSQITNDSGYITNAVNDLLNYYTKAEVDVKGGIELYDPDTQRAKYSVTEIDEMYADGKLMTWKGRIILAVYANTQWNRFLYFPRESASRQVLIYKQSVQNGSVVGDEEQIGGFSDLNFTLAHFNKLQGIETGAQKNVQTDYAEADSSKDSFLKNKPTKLSDFTNDVGYLTETTYTEIYDTANSQSFYTGTEIKTMFANNIPLVYTLANGIKYFVYAVEGSSAITLQLWTVVNSVGGSTGWAGKATIPASTKAISDVTIYTKTVLSSDISKFTGGSVSQGNTSFVSGGQVYDALQGGSLPSATTELDVLYWHNGKWTTGAITNVIPDGDNLSY